MKITPAPRTTWRSLRGAAAIGIAAFVAVGAALGQDSTLAYWSQYRQPINLGITSGTLAMRMQWDNPSATTAAPRYYLRSSQPVGTRSIIVNCNGQGQSTAPQYHPHDPATECEMTSSVINNRIMTPLIPGDVVVVRHPITLQLTGSALKAKLLIRASTAQLPAEITGRLVSEDATQVGSDFTVQLGSEVPVASFDNAASQTQRLFLELFLKVPATNNGADWGMGLQLQSISLPKVEAILLQDADRSQA